MLSSELYMLLLCGLLKSSRSTPPSELEVTSLQVKWRLAAANLLSFLLAGYVFIRHNTYCEEGSKYCNYKSLTLGSYCDSKAVVLICSSVLHFRSSGVHRRANKYGIPYDCFMGLL